jgi:flagellar biosynthesis protein FlhF
MQVKKFEAQTIQEALENVKKELGPEAIILETKKTKKGFGIMSKPFFEITAAPSNNSFNKKEYIEKRMANDKKAVIQTITPVKQEKIFDKYTTKQLDRALNTQDHVAVSSLVSQAKVSSKITATRYVDIDDHLTEEKKENTTSVFHKKSISDSYQEVSISADVNLSVENEIDSLKKMIKDLKNQQESMIGVSVSRSDKIDNHPLLKNPFVQDIFDQLVVNGIERKYAFSLLKKVEFDIGSQFSVDDDQIIDMVAIELMNQIKIISIPDLVFSYKKSKNVLNPLILAVVGPTGSGKTTTVAKLSGDLITKKNLKVGLINLDQHKASAFEQLGIYAKIIKAPFRSANSLSDLEAALQDFKNLDSVLIDTPGRSQKDTEFLKQLESLLSHFSVTSLLTVSATTRDFESYEIGSRFSIFNPQGLVISRLDEASLFGSIYNLTQKTRMSLAYFTTGQKIPEDIEEASAERVASLILGI